MWCSRCCWWPSLYLLNYLDKNHLNELDGITPGGDLQQWLHHPHRQAGQYH